MKMRTVEINRVDVREDATRDGWRVSVAFAIFRCPRCGQQKRVDGLRFFQSREELVALHGRLDPVRVAIDSAAPDCDCARVRCRVGAKYQRRYRLMRKGSAI